jgi:hypothetical protein
MKWVFDEKKYLSVAGNTKENFEKYMKDAIDKLDLSGISYPKFGANDLSELLPILKSKFNSLFILK